MTTARYLVGDVFAVLPTLEPSSVDLACTSPPFLALRRYLDDDHPHRDLEIGTESSPAEFLDTLLELTAELGRVLTPTGSIVVELGDTYSGSGGAGGDYSPGGLRDGQGKSSGSARRSGEWPLDKSLAGIPTLYSWSLAYGRNLLTGAESPAGRWIVRNVVAWTRTNPPVGATFDKFRPATSYITVATRARDRWFDSFAVQTESGAAPLDWWTVSPESYTGSHYATWPRRLLEVPIRSMCPLEVCTVCGEPRRRVVSSSRTFDNVRPGAGRARMRTEGAGPMGANYAVSRSSLGFTDCGHSSYRRGVVLDPFGGSGTTGAVATGLGRDAILVDLDDRNVELARERVGMFLEVELDPLSNPVPVVEGSPPREPVADPNARVELEGSDDPRVEVEGCADSSLAAFGAAMLEADDDTGRLW